MPRIDLSDRRIIMIHGLAAKPPAADLHGLWSRCLVENIRLDDGPLARALDAQPEVLRHAYWANAVPHHIEDDRRYVRRLGQQVEAVIDARRRQRGDFHVGMGERIGSFFKSRGADLVNIFTNALSIKEQVAKELLREIELYAEDQYISDAIRAPLERELREAWDEGREVAILAHSMGTFIAYDVLWRFSHRNQPGFREYRDRSVALLATLGSPLGDGVVRDLLFGSHHDAGTRPYPTNVRTWHNYACLGDIVSHDAELEDDYFRPMRKVKAIRGPRWRTIDYRRLHNPFEVVGHAGNRGREKRNPHASYGYLVQPRLGTWTADFLRGRL